MILDRSIRESDRLLPELGPSVGHRRWMRVLIAEDEFLVGMQLEEDLRSIGCSIVGPFNTLERATQAARCEQFDLAILDINLNGEMVYPLAEELSARGIPFIFLSGYVTGDLPERFRRSPQLTKPHHPTALSKQIEALVASRESVAGGQRRPTSGPEAGADA